LSLRRFVSQIKAELAAVRASSRVVGGRGALLARARLDLDLEGVTTDRVAELEARLAALEEVTPDLADLSRRAEAIETKSNRIDAHLKAIEIQSNNTDMVANGFGRTMESVEAVTRLQIAGIERRAASAALLARIEPVTAWVEAHELEPSLRISVMLPTHNRNEMLGRAISSVREQQYGNWELIVIDDGSSDRTPEVLVEASSADERIVVVTTPHAGVSAARNSGLAAATGDVICYLDDDNTMQPLWLKSVAWTFGREPTLEVAYGARVVEVNEGDASTTDPLPYLHFEPFDRARLEEGNYIDLGSIAHRRDLPEVHFDESLPALGDWDLILRLTRTQSPLALPVVASMYRTSSPNRISHAGHHASAKAMILSRKLRENSLRVLAYNSLFPLVSETYVGDEMHALTENGMILAWCTDRWSQSPVRVAEPHYLDLDTAVREFEPDVLFLYWAVFCKNRLNELTRIGKPFALRVHSFDFDLEVIESIRTHPLCVGVWAFPHHAAQIEGVHPLVALVRPDTVFHEPSGERTIVLSMSALVPKRDWPMLVKTFAELVRKGVDCRIVVGGTDESDVVEKNIVRLIADSGASVMFTKDVPHDQVIDLLARTAVVVYTMERNATFGMPLSIIEGMLGGASVVVPDRPEVAAVAGPNCRTYREQADIVRHVMEVLAGGPEIDDERRFNRNFARSRFVDPALGTILAAELDRAVASWHAR
jgi:glycosyltransferase involved in cell wall biosynthesis